jgi:hypothetical protein
VSRLENGLVVELINDSDRQPAWQLLVTVKTMPLVATITTPATADPRPR